MQTHPAWWRGAARTALLPVALAVVSVVGTTFAATNQPEARPLDALGYLLLLAGPAALLLRAAQPAVVYGVVASVLIGYLGLGYPLGPFFLTALAGLAYAISTGYRWPAYVITAVTFWLNLLVSWLRTPEEPVLWSALWLAWLIAFISACELWRTRRERRAEARAARAETARRQAGEERLRLARDLHDALGHHVSLINVQAGVALHLLDDDPEQARAALTAIKQSSRDLLREMRSTLGVLRAVDEQAPRQPVAGLARLDDLVAENRAAGLPVAVEVHGDVVALPAAVDLAAFRIVQESLTNTRRHAHARTATVRLDRTEDQLTVLVEDDGSGPSESGAAPGGGDGLPGMTERATALGGSLTAGARPGGGFRVQAVLPLARDRHPVDAP